MHIHFLHQPRVVVVRRAAVVVASVAMVGATLAALPASAAADGGKMSLKVEQVPNKNHGHGANSALGVAAGKARASKKPVEVPSARTATESTFANPDGTVTKKRSLSPIRAKKDGTYVPLDPTLETSEKRLRPKVSADAVSFSPDGAGTLASLDLGKAGSIGLSVKGSLGEPVIDGAVATYPLKPASTAPTSTAPTSTVPVPTLPTDEPATPSPSVSANPASPETGSSADGGASVQVAAMAGGFSTRVVLKKQPETAPTYDFGIEAGALTPSLKAGVLSFTNAKGDVVAQSSPLRMWDAKGEGSLPTNTAAVDADLAKTSSGWVLTLRPSAKFLTDPKTKYPVTIDPDISKAVAQDTYYYNGQSSASPQASSTVLYVGPVGGISPVRSLLTFTYNELLGYDIADADLTLGQISNSAPSPCVAKPLNLLPVTQEVNVAAMTWDTRPTSVSTDSRWTASKSFNHGTTCAPGFETIDVSSMVSGWAGQHLGKGLTRQAIELRAGDESDASQAKAFCSAEWVAGTLCADPTVVPMLSVTYQPQLGSQSWFSMTTHKLNDHSNIAVNNQSGNAVVQARDANINGVGLNLEISRTYNTQDQDTTSLGRGWRLSLGPDVWLEHKSDTRFDYHGPGGTTFGSFVRKSSNPADPDYDEFSTPVGGVDADLDQSGSTYTLTFHDSQAKFTFSDNAAGNDNAYLTKLEDRSGNHITIAYSGTTSGGVPKMTSITDTNSRNYAVTYVGDYVTKIQNTATGPGTRAWTYGYTGDYLTTYTDPAGKAYTYTYADAAAGPDLLTQIQDPASSAGARPTTYIDYDGNTPINTNQAFGVRYRYGSGATDAYNYTWDYNTAIVSACDGNGDFSTVVTDPNNHDTTHCFRNRDTVTGLAKTWTYDALGHARSAEYNADNAPTNITSPTGQNITNGSTVAAYSTSLVDQLDTVTNPKGDAAQSATTGFEYANSNNPAGGDYLPSAVKGTSGTCNRFGYDSKGRTTDSYTGIAATSDNVSSCGGTSGAKHTHRDYDDDTGNVTKSWDANAGSSSPADDDSTIYTYWKTTDTGYVAGTTDQVKTIRKPGGNCATTVAAGRKLCTSYTYDGAARVLSVTNGNADVTKYSYDKLDRTTGAFYGGSAACDLLVSNCVKYVYDAEGNLTSRTEGLTLTSNFTYDQLNRQISIANPTVLLSPNDNIGLAFDGAGNLTTYGQQISGNSDNVYYGYDAADQLTTVLDNTGFTYVDTNADGRVTTVAYPRPAGTDGMKVDYDYTSAGKPKSMDIKNLSGSTTRASFDYDYTKTLYAGPFAIQIESSQLQNRTVTGSLSNLNSDVDYTYNNDNQLTGANDSSGTDYSYGRDDVGNLTTEQAGSSTTYYGYDRAGELCWKGPNNGTHLARACPATPTGDTAVTQDPAGNSTGSAGEAIAYNDRNQVTSIGGVAMTYRDQGNDLRKNTGTTRTVTGPLGITATDDGSTVTFYTRDPHGTILNSHDSTGAAVNYVTEHNGSVAALYSPAGAAVGSYKYAPYGGASVDDETGSTQAEANRFRYIGGYQDTTSGGTDGYYKLGARYYDTHAHFTQPDSIQGSIQNPKTLSAYNYAGSDPINSSDPSGNCDIADLFCYVETVERYAAPVVLAGLTVSVGYGGFLACTAATFGACVVTLPFIAGGVAAGVYGTYQLARRTY